MTDGAEQIHGPEERVVSVAQGVQNTNGMIVLPVASFRLLKKTHLRRSAPPTRKSSLIANGL
jgi:hypothetical protein